jgi:putative peptide zinc metalloprotease protein
MALCRCPEVALPTPANPHVLPQFAMSSVIDPAQQRLPAWREDLSLQSAPRGIDGAPHWNLYDPVRNSFFRIGWLEFALLSNWQGGITVAELCQRVANSSPLQAGVDDVLNLLTFLQRHELLRASHTEARKHLQQLAQSRQLSIWTWLLHHYLFVRIPLVQPERFLQATQAMVERLLRPGLLWSIAALSLLGVWRVLDQWQAFSQTFLYFFSWQGALCYGAALVLSKLLHELGHAYTARHYGLRVPTMGVAIMMLWPLLYTDTSEGWKLNSRRARLAIGGAGVVAELMLAGLAAFAWSILPEGPLKSAAYVLAAVTWVSTIAVNLNPFMRFDGYYLLMDAVDMPNLHPRSFAFGLWHLRRAVLGWQTPIPESEYEAHQGWLIVYAWSIWLYRLVLFTGIAAAVYYFFFKLAGIILFAVEIGWFVVRPVALEMAVWQKHWPEWRRQKRAWLSLALLLLLIIICAVPWHARIHGDGYWQAAQHTRLFPPMPAQVARILVHEGQQVSVGTPLFALQSPEIDSQLRAIDSRIRGLQTRLAGAIGEIQLQEHTQVWQQELVAAGAERNYLLEQQARLQMSAPHAGVIRDLEAGLYQSSWVRPQQALARLIDAQASSVQIFVGENDVARIQPGARAHVLLHRADGISFDAVVSNIDRTATHSLPHPMLASSHGGPIAVRSGPNGELLTNEAWYRITLKVENGPPNAQMSPVIGWIEGERQSLLGLFLRQVAGVLIRESGL